MGLGKSGAKWSSAQTPLPASSATHPFCLQVACRRSGEKAPCTFRDLKPSTRYCVQTVAADMSQERSREAKQCMMTATGTAGGTSHQLIWGPACGMGMCGAVGHPPLSHSGWVGGPVRIFVWEIES